MKKCFVLCRSIEQFNRDSVIFRLWVGSSRRDQTMLALVNALSDDMGWFLRQVDEDTDFVLMSAAEKLYPDSTLPLCHVRQVSMYISDFYRRISDSNLEVIEANVTMPANSFQTIAMLDPRSLPIQSVIDASKSCLRRQRKNLSHVKKDLLFVNVMCAAVVMGVFLIDALVTYLFGLY